MASIDIEYKGMSFEENPGLITWVQLFLIKELRLLNERSDWVNKLIEELEWNSKIDIYKYIFDEDILSNKEKEEWAISFLKSAEAKMNAMSLQDFSHFISENISDKVDYNRVKNVVIKLREMIELSHLS